MHPLILAIRRPFRVERKRFLIGCRGHHVQTMLSVTRVVLIGVILPHCHVPDDFIEAESCRGLSRRVCSKVNTPLKALGQALSRPRCGDLSEEAPRPVVLPPTAAHAYPVPRLDFPKQMKSAHVPHPTQCFRGLLHGTACAKPKPQRSFTSQPQTCAQNVDVLIRWTAPRFDRTGSVAR